MKFYISTTGLKRLPIPNNGKGSAPKATAASIRRISSRTVLPLVILLGIVLPFLFVRVAFLVLESASASSSSIIDCFGWSILSGSDTSLRLKDELNRALLEAKESSIGEGGLQSFDELVKQVTSETDDIKTFAFKTKAMLSQMERKVQSASQRESIYWHLASHGIPKSLHCLCLKLAEEYAQNVKARSRLPPPENASRLVDPSLHHLVLLTDNVLAASVVVSSTLQSSANHEKLVFHIVTDKKTFKSMHAWFAFNSIKSATIEVKGLHQYYWSEKVNAGVKEMMEIHRLTWKRYYNSLKEDIEQGTENNRSLEALSPSSLCLMNHLRVFIPEMFPDLNKIVFVDDDIVVQRDISSLWELDLKDRVIGAVFNSWCGDTCCPGGKYMDYLNFSNSAISSNLVPDHCSWLYGINVFDLEAWRKTKLTGKYLQWLKLNLESGLTLWNPGSLPPALVAFDGHVHPLDPSLLVSGLGHRSTEISQETLDTASVVHFNGPAKPWMEIGLPEVRKLWNRHVNYSDIFISRCSVTH